MPRFDCRALRRTVLRMAYSGGTAHAACAMSLVEILAVLYRRHLRLGSSGPRDPQRDYLVLSKGHGVMAQYACLHELGWLEDAEIDNYFKDGTRLHGLSHSHVPGLEVTSGSLGHGLSIGVGLALGCRRQGSDQRVFAILGDGELNAGPIWEAALFAAHHRLGNLIAIVDANGFQALGPTEDVLALGDIAAKFKAFGWEAVHVDGHDEAALDACLLDAIQRKSPAPRAIIAKTVKGKGVSFMENENQWHYFRLNADTYATALAELSS